MCVIWYFCLQGDLSERGLMVSGLVPLGHGIWNMHGRESIRGAVSDLSLALREQLCHICHCNSPKYIVWSLLVMEYGICMGGHQRNSLWFMIFSARNKFVTFVTVIPRTKLSWSWNMHGRASEELPLIYHFLCEGQLCHCNFQDYFIFNPPWIINGS